MPSPPLKNVNPASHKRDGPLGGARLLRSDALDKNGKCDKPPDMDLEVGDQEVRPQAETSLASPTRD